MTTQDLFAAYLQAAKEHDEAKAAPWVAARGLDLPGDGAMSRTVSYSWEREHSLPWCEQAERLLQRAQRDGVVSQWDSDTGWRSLWFVGKPGAKLRALRRELWRLWVMDGR